MAAGVAALDSDVQNAMIRFERVITDARDALSRVRMESLSPNLKTRVDEPFPEPFAVRVTGASEQPIAGVRLTVTYREARSGGRLTMRSASIQSDTSGVAVFSHPVPRAAGTFQLIVSLDLRAELEPLRSARSKAGDLVEGLEDVINGKRVTIDYIVESASASIATAVLIFEYDADGKRLSSYHAVSGLVSALTESGFNTTSLAGESSLRSIEEGNLLRTVAGGYDDYGRLAHGSVRVLDISESDGSTLMRVQGSVSVTDLESGRTVYSVNETKTVRFRGNSVDLAAGFTSVGEQLGQTLARELP